MLSFARTSAGVGFGGVESGGGNEFFCGGLTVSMIGNLDPCLLSLLRRKLLASTPKRYTTQTRSPHPPSRPPRDRILEAFVQLYCLRDGYIAKNVDNRGVNVRHSSGDRGARQAGRAHTPCVYVHVVSVRRRPVQHFRFAKENQPNDVNCHRGHEPIGLLWISTIIQQ